MSHVLTEDFPNDVDRIRDLRNDNAHFKKLTDDYHALNRSVHRAETHVEPTYNFNKEDLHDQWIPLKDEIAAMLAQ